MKFLTWLKSTPLMLVVPAVVLVATVVWAMSSYEPLEFIASPYEAQDAEAVSLSEIDPDEIEAAGEAATTEASLDFDQEVSVAALGDGTWTGYAPCGEGNSDDWQPYYVATTVVVSGGEVQNISRIEGSSTGDVGDATLFWDATENQSYLDWAIDGRTRSGVFYTGVKAQIEESVAAGENPSTIDVVSGATYSSQAIFNSYYAALKKAASAVGATVDEPPPRHA